MRPRKAVAVFSALALFSCTDRDGDTDTVATPPPDEVGAVNLDVWLERLEVGSREIYSARQNVTAALDLAPGERIADIGAGTGIYTLLFAERVGPDGVVYAVDIAPRFLSLINQRADDLGLSNVVSVLSRPDSITLPAASVDAVFIADTYHYFDMPDLLMGTVFKALKPGGRLYIVDFERSDDIASAGRHRHVRFGKQGLAEEVSIYGFILEREIAVAGLSDNYMLEFRRP